MIMTREPFVFESKIRELVERTMDRLNQVDKEKTYNIDFEDGVWYVFEVTDEDEI